MNDIELKDFLVDVFVKGCAISLSAFVVFLNWYMRGYPQTNIEQMLNGLIMFVGYFVWKDFLYLLVKANRVKVSNKRKTKRGEISESSHNQ